jgi:hypothetical protein
MKRAPVWEFRHSIECRTTPQFAWEYWANIANWNDPPATFHLDGPFAAGSQLTTSLPGQTWHSVIREVKAGREAIIEMQLPGAALSFYWKFEDLPGNRCRITQHLALRGSGAKPFVGQVAAFEQTAPAGMKKLVDAIERASNTLTRRKAGVSSRATYAKRAGIVECNKSWATGSLSNSRSPCLNGISRRVVPIWFHWNEKEIVLGTPLKAPKVNGAVAKAGCRAEHR